jgi:myo-inositol-1(or 4)-monophosphatase
MAANPKIYGQLVGITAKYSKFASAGDKAAVRQATSAAPAIGTDNPADDDCPPTVHVAPF